MSAQTVTIPVPIAPEEADDLAAVAARYLAIQVEELEARLAAGESMGAIALRRGRSIDGLFDVLLVACERRLPPELPQEHRLRVVERTIVTEAVR
jgi:hypothetical protein